MKLLARDEPPADFLQAVSSIIKMGRNVLLVGNTDQFGPKLLNQSLALQYAINTAYRLSSKLQVEPARFQCVSSGEDPAGGEAGIAVFSAELKPAPKPGVPASVMVLEPAADGELTSDFAAIWESDAKTVFWGREEGAVTSLWKVVTSGTPFQMPYPAKSARLALGVEFGDDQGLCEIGWKEAPVDKRLTLTVESLESGWARVSGKTPHGATNITVWAGGIPYPVAPEGLRFDANIAKFGNEMEVYAQANDSRGRLIVGPTLRMPPAEQGDPKVIAVLTWEGENTDLDLHCWKGDLHTQPQDPDPSMSERAAPGVRLLFDGDGRSRASALSARDDKDLEVVVRVFSDLGGGARAMLFIVTDPGDPIMRRGRIIGPRELSGDSIWSRWAALNLRGKK